MAKRKKLNTEDMEAVAGIIRKQELLIEIDQEQDKDGNMKFMNMVACRNIREGILEYLKKHIDPDAIPYNEFEGLSCWGERAYIKKHNSR